MIFGALPSLLPSLVAMALIATSVTAFRLRGGRPIWVEVLTQVVLFILLTITMDAVLGSPLHPRYQAASSEQRLWEQAIEAGWWIVCGRVTVGFARLSVVLEGCPRETRIVSDLLAGVITVGTFLAIVNFVFEVPISGLLATSGVIAIVLGLALQNSLSDVFSGLAMGLERPYKPGDLLWIEGGVEGRVLQVDWRSTQIMTDDSNVAIVPNSVMAKSRLINRSAPTPIRGATATIILDSRALPRRCLDALDAAARSCNAMLDEPAPTVSCTGLKGNGSTWEVSFSVATTERLAAARTELFNQIHRQLLHAGISLAIDGNALPPPDVPTVSQMLEGSDLFGAMAADARTSLSPYFQPQRLEAGDTLVREGEVPDALFLIGSGAAEVTTATAGGHRLIHRIGPGESLGAVALITAVPYAATVTALTALQAFRLTKKDIAAAIAEAPDLAAALDDLARHGRDMLRHDLAVTDQAKFSQAHARSSPLRTFLAVMGGEWSLR